MENKIIENRYHIQKHIKSINEGDYYEGYDQHNQQVILMRILDTTKVGETGQGLESLAPHKIKSQMLFEQRVISKLNHPNLLTILDHGFDAPYYYHVYPLVPFVTLDDIIMKQEPIALDKILKYAVELADTFAHLHRIGIVHCDIKPLNILVINNSMRVIEFMIANHDQIDHVTLGTPSYMSPEAITGTPVHPTRDIWSLGVILYQLITGTLPFGAMLSPADVPTIFQNVLSTTATSITQYAPQLPPRLVALIQWMMEKDPAKRIDSMRKVGAELETILNELEIGIKIIKTGEILNERYQLQTLIGNGAFGQVFRGADLQTGSTIAIKQFLLTTQVNQSLIDRFRRDARILRQLSHPNIVKIVDTFENSGNYFIALEYVSGGDLSHLIKQSPLNIITTIKITKHVADALSSAHQQGVIHRDIKPANILLTDNHTPKLADFGIAYQTDVTTLTQAGQLVGTIAYLAPEALNNNVRSDLSDIWSLGVVLYEMLAGERPFVGTTISELIAKILSDPIPDIDDIRSDCPYALTNLIAHMLERDISKRIQTMQEVANRLNQIYENETKTET